MVHRRCLHSGTPCFLPRHIYFHQINLLYTYLLSRRNVRFKAYALSDHSFGDLQGISWMSDGDKHSRAHSYKHRSTTLQLWVYMLIYTVRSSPNSRAKSQTGPILASTICKNHQDHHQPLPAGHGVAGPGRAGTPGNHPGAAEALAAAVAEEHCVQAFEAAAPSTRC